ncbi:MAG: hypothetical protein ACRC1I_09155 [Pseudomonas proteolytica]|uniref:hypothetical protein n=1 Tax=Pseudomonas proteolytica TaxID=219574 RepID=UPI0021F96322|nr:hypothetical protein [Pseudomonas proteolytica]USX02892.1 hypothetical protein NHF41_14590 [Pseudomonas proteolytica]
MLKKTIIAGFTFALTGCGLLPPPAPPAPPTVEHSIASKTEIADAKSKLLRRISDPDSAKFETIYKFKGRFASGKSYEGVCGYVNYKGAEGGYEGFTPFMVVGDVVSYYGDHLPHNYHILKSFCTKSRSS